MNQKLQKYTDEQLRETLTDIDRLPLASLKKEILDELELRKNNKNMKPDLRIDQQDLKVLFSHTIGAYGNMTFEKWCDDCKKSYLSYFENKEMFNINKYTYSQFVNAQILAIT